MRILFLDDDRLRHDAFAATHGADEVVHVFTAHEAVAALAGQGRFDLAQLDHDLAEEFYLALSGGLRETPEPGDPPYDPGTGMDVVRHIISLPVEQRPGKVVVHTHNAVGSVMVGELERAGVPATWVRFG
jgi:CheY-like chemotaxis protein